MASEINEYIPPHWQSLYDAIEQVGIFFYPREWTRYERHCEKSEQPSNGLAAMMSQETTYKSPKHSDLEAKLLETVRDSMLARRLAVSGMIKGVTITEQLNELKAIRSNDQLTHFDNSTGPKRLLSALAQQSTQETNALRTRSRSKESLYTQSARELKGHEIRELQSEVREFREWFELTSRRNDVEKRCRDALCRGTVTACRHSLNGERIDIEPALWGGAPGDDAIKSMWPGVWVEDGQIPCAVVLKKHSLLSAVTGEIFDKPAPKVRKRGRPKGAGSLDKADAPLVQEMHEMRMANKSLSPWRAAGMVAEANANKFTCTVESTQKRLSGRYKKTYSE